MPTYPLPSVKWLPIASALASLCLAGCPFAQPVPGVEQKDGGTLTPPRIALTSVQPPETAILYDPACPGGALFQLKANIVDESTADKVEARWFVDYDPDVDSRKNFVDYYESLPPEDPLQMVRTIPPFDFKPQGWIDTWLAPRHVVELVISNGFAQRNGRDPAPGYEVQLFRWVFVEAAGGRCKN